jgi:hypothetical protein
LRTVQESNRSFTDKVLGAGPSPNTGQPINADAEVAKRTGGKKASADVKKKSSGGGWFDWF